MVEATAGSMISAWAKIWTLPVDCADAGVRMAETITIAPLVVQARLPTLQAAMVDPWSADHAELQRMVGEKIVAWGKAAATLQSDALSLAMRPMSSNVGQIWLDWLAMIDIACRMPGRSHRPIHRAVIANHRRLGVKTKR